MIIVNTCHIKDMPMPVEGDEPAETLGLSFDNIQEGIPVSDIEYRLMATKMNQDLLVTGTACFDMRALCSRCGREFETTIRTGKLCLLYEKVPDQEVDVTDDIREELLLAIPTYIRCKEDCAGVCLKCGANLNDGPCDCEADDSEEKKEDTATEDAASPWAALDGFKADK